MKGPSEHPFFRRFFGPRYRAPNRRANSLGSGVVVSEDGLILTNNHVIEGADEIIVTLADGNDRNAKLIGADPASDVAVLRIEGNSQSIDYMPLGDSDALRLGESVIAIGNPFGLGHTVTQGIVSAVGRANMGITDYENFIQTDAAINPGNSGGALVNRRGELVGINTAIVSRTGGYQGIGFAIPTSMARGIMKNLVETGRVSRGWLGIGIQALSNELAQRLDVPVDTQGVLVSGVLLGTPAANAGLMAGDIITHIDRDIMKTPSQLRNTVAAKGGKAKVRLRYFRDGEAKKMSLVLGEKKQGPGALGRFDTDQQSRGGELGLGLRDLDDRLARRLDVAPGTEGVAVVQVDPGSPADKAGLSEGDVILEIDQQKVSSVRAAKKQLKKMEGSALLRVERNGGSQFIIMKRMK